VADLRNAKSAYNGYALIFLAVVFFSTIEVGSQHLQREMGVSALDISVLRFSIGGIFLVIVVWAQAGHKKLFEIVRADGLKLALLGLLGATAVSLCFHRSLMLTSSMIGGAIFSINPAIVALLYAVFRVDKLTWSRAIGIILGLACVLVTNIGAQAHEPEFPRYFLGNMFMVGSVLAWSFYFLLVRDYIRKYGGLLVSAIVVVSGSLGLLLFAPFAPSLGWGKSLAFFTELTLSGWVLALYLGVVTVGVGYYLLYTGLSITGISSGMMIFFIKPALVAVLANFLQGQPLSAWIWLGIILATASIFVVSMAGRTG
jgi:drug/metabolite transporter (DMT)-like permease